jgi:hypothetical protein
MPGILPEIETAGGLVYRDAAGNPTNPLNVQSAYSPSPAFLSSCLLTALPTDCTARIEAKQVNAIVSEFLSFAECLDPNGPWDCNSLRNLCAAFNVWVSMNLNFIMVGDTPPANPQPNSLWWESDKGFTYLWYNDGTSAQWVQIAGQMPAVDKISIVGAGSEVDPLNVGLVDCGSYGVPPS